MIIPFPQSIPKAPKRRIRKSSSGITTKEVAAHRIATGIVIQFPRTRKSFPASSLRRFFAEEDSQEFQIRRGDELMVAPCESCKDGDLVMIKPGDTYLFRSYNHFCEPVLVGKVVTITRKL